MNMNPITQVFDAVLEMIHEYSINDAALVGTLDVGYTDVGTPTNVYSDVIVGAMPPHNGIAAQISTGATDTTFLNKGLEIGLSVILNGKHEDQLTALDTLNKIHQSLTMTKEYPKFDSFQIVDIRTDSYPNYIGREDNEYLYGSALRVRAFIKQQQFAAPVTPFDPTPIK